jgi:tetratricopeptide (TPR) repeat protein
MKRLFLIVGIVSLFAVNAFSASHFSDDQPVVSIGINDLIIVSDVNKVMEYAKAKGLNDRALDQIKLADESYVKGVQFLQQSSPTEAIQSFKTSFKNYKRAKLSEDALNFANLQLAVAHQLSDDDRNKKKVMRYLELVTKSIEKEKEWVYNLAILNYLNNNESRSAELLESVIKMDKEFFKAYGNLAAVYQTINQPKKAEKTLSRLKVAQDVLAEKQRKEQLALAKKKEKAKKSGKTEEPVVAEEPPKGISIDPLLLKVKGDSKSVLKNESITAFDDRMRKKLREGQEYYDQGVVLFNSGEFPLAIKAFKSSLKKFNQAKVSQLTLSYVNANLAMSYFKSPEKRDRKKVIPIIETLSKSVYDDRDWAYNIAVIQHGMGNSEKALDLLEDCNALDKYFLLSYQNQVAIHNDLEDLKSAKKAFKLHEKYKNELTEIYKEYVKTGVKNENVDLSFLEGAVFRVALGDFSEFNMPIDIYLHDDLLTIPLGNDFYSFICGNYNSYSSAEAYLSKVFNNGYENAFIIAFKDGVRTDFASDFK